MPWMEIESARWGSILCLSNAQQPRTARRQDQKDISHLITLSLLYQLKQHIFEYVNDHDKKQIEKLKEEKRTKCYYIM